MQFFRCKIDSTHAIHKRMEAPVASGFLLEERMLLRIFSGDDTPIQNLPAEEKTLGEKGDSHY